MDIISRKDAQALGLKRYFTGVPCSHGHVAERYVTKSCCECQKISRNKWGAANPDAVQEALRNWRAENPEYYRERRAADPEGARDALRKWRASNPEADRNSRLKRYATNPEIFREASRKWHAANAEAVREAGRKRGAANPEIIRAKNSKQYATNAEALREKSNKYRAANPETVREATRKWNAANPGYASAATKRREASKLQRTPPWFDAAKVLPFYELAALLTQQTGVPHEVDHVIPLQGKLVSGLHVAENLQVLTKIQNCRKHNKFVPA